MKDEARCNCGKQLEASLNFAIGDAIDKTKKMYEMWLNQVRLVERIEYLEKELRKKDSWPAYDVEIPGQCPTCKQVTWGKR